MMCIHKCTEFAFFAYLDFYVRAKYKILQEWFKTLLLGITNTLHMTHPSWEFVTFVAMHIQELHRCYC